VPASANRWDVLLVAVVLVTGCASEGGSAFTPLEWNIEPDAVRGIHTVSMIVGANPQTGDQIEDVSGRLIWPTAVVDLCGVRTRGVADGFLNIGDIFQTTEGCGDNPNAMQDAFREFGMPELACLTVSLGAFGSLQHCAPLDRQDPSEEWTMPPPPG
jgi:hypothetical protein